MLKWHELELTYAQLLRESAPAERRRLFAEAYEAVSSARAAVMPERPEERTAGTSDALIQELAKLCSPQDRVLEIGCGRGYTCLKLAPQVRSMVGTDITDVVLEEARRLLDTNGIRKVEIRRAYAEELAETFAPGSFDVAISIDVYEHLHPEDARKHLEGIASVLRPGGRCIVVTPNRITGPHDMTCSVFPDAAEPLGFHLNETTYGELGDLLRAAGFDRLQMVLPFPRFLPTRGVIRLPIQLARAAERVRARGVPIMARLAGAMIGRIFLVARKAGG